MLGEACNYHCRHCVQHDIHNRITKHPSQTTIEYIKHLANIRPRGFRNISDNIKVIFFGGEPLLYFACIKQIIESVDVDNVHYSIISNGELLTKDIVDYINQHNITFVLSNDGRQTDKVRDRNLLEDDNWLKLFKSIKTKSIDATLHAYNLDLYDLWDYVESKVGNIPIHYEHLVVNWNMPKDIYDFNYQAWDRTCKRIKDNLFKAYTSSDKNLSDTREAQFFNRLIQRFYDFKENKGYYPACGAFRNNINIDLDGNVYLCHNGVGKLGKIDQYDDGVNGGAYYALKASNKFLKIRNADSKPCLSCIAYPFCQQGCPLADNNKGQQACCKVYQILAKHVISFMHDIEQYYNTEIDL